MVFQFAVAISLFKILGFFGITSHLQLLFVPSGSTQLSGLFLV